MRTLDQAEELEIWNEYQDNIEAALTSVQRACGYLTKARFLNEMKLYNDMSFTNPPLQYQHGLEIISSALLNLRNRVVDLRGSTPKVK